MDELPVGRKSRQDWGIPVRLKVRLNAEPSQLPSSSDDRVRMVDTGQDEGDGDQLLGGAKGGRPSTVQGSLIPGTDNRSCLAKLVSMQVTSFFASRSILQPISHQVILLYPPAVRASEN